MLVVNASNIEKDWNWIKQHNTGNAEMHNITEVAYNVQTVVDLPAGRQVPNTTFQLIIK